MKSIRKAVFAYAAILFTGLFLMGCPDPDTSYIKSDFEGKILILQAYGSTDDARGATHSFVELYNITDEELDLSGITLHYAAGSRGLDVKDDWGWETIPLSGKIPAKGSFLIMGKHEESTVARYKMDEVHGPDYGDINDDNFTLNNRSFKVALIEGNAKINVQNPFDMNGHGKKFDGYIDMVGAVNDPNHTNPDNIFGYEKAPARCSASEAVRRRDLNDTNNNSVDFIAARYGPTDGNRISMTDEEFEVRYPRNSKAGSWKPFDPPVYEGPYVEAGTPADLAGKLLILQAYAPNAGAAGASHPFVELYNNTEASIDLSGINLYYADGTRNTSGSSSNPGPVATQDGPWKSIALTGTIPAKGSFLVLGRIQVLMDGCK